MPKYIAFLRAINVGGHTVKMEQLRELFTELGFENVETFIASGNVIFETTARGLPALEKKIDKHLKGALGYEVGTFLRTPAELAKIVAHKPFPASQIEATGSSMYVAFLRTALGKENQEKVAALQTEMDEFHIHGRELYWWCRKKLTDSLVSGPQLAKAVGEPTTMRNVNTVRKLAAKYESK